MTTGTGPERGFSELLLAWYGTAKRELPWRRDADPYRIWVSETMLQQTRVDTVIPYFNRFLSAFPTPSALAGAEEAEVYKLWEGLGYYSRARNLHRAAQEVVLRHGGTLPASYELFRALPGVGEYTAGAVMSIAFGLAVPAVDGNVLRVFSRLLAILEDVRGTAVKRRIADAVKEAIPADRASDFNQALMELGALVCTPKNPRCGECPVESFCEARKMGIEARLPARRQRQSVMTERRAAVFLRDARGAVCIRRRPPGGLLASMWELPHLLMAMEEPGDLLQELSGRWGELELPPVRDLRYAGEYRHQFSHLRWSISLFVGIPQFVGTPHPPGPQEALAGTAREDAPGYAAPRFASREERSRLAFAKVFHKILSEEARIMAGGEGTDPGESNGSDQC